MLVWYSSDENKASFLHNSHFLCCVGQTAAPRNTVRTAADEVLSKDYSFLSRDVHFLSGLLHRQEVLQLSPKNFLLHGKPYFSHQHQNRKRNGWPKLVISVCKKNWELARKIEYSITSHELTLISFQVFWDWMLLPHWQERGKKTTLMAFKHWNVSAEEETLLF